MKEKVKEKEVEVVEEKQDEELLSVISSGEKLITYTSKEEGFDLTIKLKLPTMKQKNTSEMLYSKTYNRLLQDDDHMTTTQLMSTARKRGTWSEEDEGRLASIDMDIIAKKELVGSEKNKKKKEKLEENLVSLREEKFRLALKIGQISGTSIETISEKEKTCFLLITCLFLITEEGEDVLMYPTRSDLDNEQDLKKLEAVLLDAKSFWSGEGLSDFLHLGD